MDHYSSKSGYTWNKENQNLLRYLKCCIYLMCTYKRCAWVCISLSKDNKEICQYKNCSCHLSGKGCEINDCQRQISSDDNLEKLEKLANVLSTLPSTLKKASNVINKVKELFSDEQMAYLTTLSNNEKTICNTFQNLNLNITFTEEEITALGLNQAQVDGISTGLTNKTAPLKSTLSETGKKACTDNLILNGGTNPQTGAKVVGLIPTLLNMKNEISSLEGSLSAFSNYDLNDISKNIKSLEQG